MEKLVHDAHRMTDSATATSRCSLSQVPIVWFLLLLMPTGRDVFVDLTVLMASVILADVEGVEEASTVVSS
jgi:hypothetical protein